MGRRATRDLLVLAIIAIGSSSALDAAGPVAPQEARWRDGVVLLKLEDPSRMSGAATGLPAVDAILRSGGVIGLRPALHLDRVRWSDLKRRFGLDRILAVEFPDGAPVASIAEALSRADGV